MSTYSWNRLILKEPLKFTILPSMKWQSKKDTKKKNESAKNRILINLEQRDMKQHDQMRNFLFTLKSYKIFVHPALIPGKSVFLLID